jgi:hypothetical protein
MANELFPFKFYDPLRKRWIQARHKATREESHRAMRSGKSGPGWTPRNMDGRPHPNAA